MNQLLGLRSKAETLSVKKLRENSTVNKFVSEEVVLFLLLQSESSIKFMSVFLADNGHTKMYCYCNRNLSVLVFQAFFHDGEMCARHDCG